MTSPYDKALVACVSKRRAMTSSTQHGPGDYVNECLTGVTASDHMLLNNGRQWQKFMMGVAGDWAEVLAMTFHGTTAPVGDWEEAA